MRRTVPPSIEVGLQSGEADEVEPVVAEVVDVAVGHQQHLGRGELLDELGVVADEDDRARPVAERVGDGLARLAGRGCWSARRAAAGCCARPSASPAPAWSSRRPTACRPPGTPSRRDSPNMPSRPRSWVSVSSTPGGTSSRMLSSSDSSDAQVVVLLGVVPDVDVVAEVERRRDRPSVSPARMRSRLVLPAPLRPSTSRRSPRPRSKSTSSNTGGPP